MESTAFAHSAGRAPSHARTIAVPWQLAAVIFAATSVIVGLLWDISWHMTIGRDTFWTPAHLAIYTGGAVAGIASGFEVLRRSFFSPKPLTDGVTIWRVLTVPWVDGWPSGAPRRCSHQRRSTIGGTIRTDWT